MFQTTLLPQTAALCLLAASLCRYFGLQAASPCLIWYILVHFGIYFAKFCTFLVTLEGLRTRDPAFWQRVSLWRLNSYDKDYDVVSVSMIYYLYLQKHYTMKVLKKYEQSTIWQVLENGWRKFLESWKIYHRGFY